MKRVKTALRRLCACALALMLLCGACLASGGDAFVGEWAEPIAGRANLTIEKVGEGYDITIFWSNSAFEHSEWHMTGVYNAALDAIVCEDCKCVNVLYDENDNVHEEVVYTGGDAAFTFEGGAIHWSDAQEDAGGNIEFTMKPYYY